jgi:hypothetical protein
MSEGKAKQDLDIKAELTSKIISVDEWIWNSEVLRVE